MKKTRRMDPTLRNSQEDVAQNFRKEKMRSAQFKDIELFVHLCWMASTRISVLWLLVLLLWKWGASTVESVSEGELSALQDMASAWNIQQYWNLTGVCGQFLYGITCTNNSITEVNLPGLGLTGTIPTSISKLSSLTRLDLGSNMLTGSIPFSISNLSELQQLFLGSNDFSGQIPSEFGKLTKMKSLNLDNNQLTGPIPSSLANLTALRQLTLRVNSIHGSIPPEIGQLRELQFLYLDRNQLTGSIPPSIVNLTALTFLGLGTNHFTGQIPPDIDKMVSLRNLRLDNNRLANQIPSTIGNLKNLTELYLQGNAFHGPIPSELGLLGNLSILRLHANHLNGTIPASFANLSKIMDLRLSYNNLRGSIEVLDSVANNLELLWLQRNSFSGPLFSGSFSSLTYLDIGFNMLSGAIPSNLQLPIVQDISLCHNNLSGSIPAALTSSSALISLDLSHNLFSGSMPSIGRNVQSNFAFNYFNNGNTYSCNAKTGFLDPCTPSTPGNHSTLYVNTGGDEVRKGSISFAKDTATADSPVLLEQDTWALELSGNYSGVKSSSQFQEPYASMRWSSSYLAYYATQLQNGRYNVTLYFSEITSAEEGDRVFDVYVQKTMLSKDLDVVKVANGSNPIQLWKLVEVSNGLLSIELVAELENEFTDPSLHGPMLSAFSVVSLSIAESKKETKLGLIIGLTIGSLAFLAIILVIIFLWGRGKAKSDHQLHLFPRATEGNFLPLGPKVYAYQDVSEATEGFSHKMKIGQGAFGAVYKGNLKREGPIAVKRLTHKNPTIEADFRKEIAILSMLQHRNLVGIRGYCVYSDVYIIICELMPKGSLDKLLFDSYEILDWESRRNIAIGAASGLAYLHDESKIHVIHCDVKAANILLDGELNACISDFGMARLYSERDIHVTASKLQGTVGYLAPEYALQNKLSDKVDVYSFGVVLLEILSGRRSINRKLPPPQTVLVDWARMLAAAPMGNLLEIVDPKLEENFAEEDAMEMARIAVLCTQNYPELRPTMREVWQMLIKSVSIPEVACEVGWSEEGRSFASSTGEETSEQLI